MAKTCCMMIGLEKRIKSLEDSMKELISDDKYIMEYYKKWVDSRISMVKFIREQTRIQEEQQYKGEV